MWRFMIQHQKEGFVGFSVFPHPSNGVLRNQVGCIAMLGNRISVLGNHFRLVIDALPRQHLPVIESGGFTYQMPLSHQSGLVSYFL